MSEKHSHYDSDDIELEESVFRNAESEQNNWLTSYSDIVTLLLCFFIIFYYIEKNIDKGTGMENIIAQIKDEFGVKGAGKGNLEKAQGNSKVPLDAKDKIKKFPFSLGEGFITTLSHINSSQKSQVLNAHDHVAIVFQNEEFFRFSSSILNERGKEVIGPIIQKLMPVMDKIVINIRGHSDNIPVTKPNNKAWWKNNIELSTARALNVREYLISQGVPEEALYISGLGQIHSYKDDIDIEQVDIDGKKFEPSENLERRISIRIEPRLKAKK
jgi:chemotaxis protein MotB